MTRTLLAACFAAVALAPFGAARAQPSSSEAAQRLFDAGKAAMDRKDYAVACADFEASVAAEPGIGARLWLADCYESMGRTASASREFLRAAAAAAEARDNREPVARARARALEAKLIHVTIVVAPADRDTTQIELDDKALEPAALAAPIAIDPGKHVVRARGGYGLPFEVVIETGGAGSATTIEIPSRARAASPVAPKVEPAPAPPPEARSGGSSTGRIVGATVFGGGLVGLGFGAAFAVKAGHDLSISNQICNETVCASERGRDARFTARHEANAATAFFIGGGVLAAGGAALFLFSRPKSAVVTANLGGVGLRATF